MDGKTTHLGEMLLSRGVKIAHHKVRNFLLDGDNIVMGRNEASAVLRKGGVTLVRIYGYRRNRKIHIIHQNNHLL